MKAVEVLIEHGVPEERIIFINLVFALSLSLFLMSELPCVKIASPEGLTNFCSKYPSLRVVRYPFIIFFKLGIFLTKTPFIDHRLD